MFPHIRSSSCGRPDISSIHLFVRRPENNYKPAIPNIIKIKINIAKISHINGKLARKAVTKTLSDFTVFTVLKGLNTLKVLKLVKLIDY